MHKKHILFVGLFLIAFSLCGCGDLTPVTDEQSEIVSEYASSLLLKYDAKEHSRLVDTEAIVTKYNDALNDYNEAKAKYEEKLAKEEKKKQQEAEKQQADNESKGETEKNDNGGATIIDTMTIAQFLDINYDVGYSGYSLVKSYPGDSTDYFFSMDATSGHDLLVVKFDVTNLSSDTQDLDVMSKNLTFKLSINGEGFHSAYKTMLDDDFSEYVGSFKGQETKTVVLIAEVEEGKNITSIDMRLSDTKGNSITKKLMN